MTVRNMVSNIDKWPELRVRIDPRIKAVLDERRHLQHFYPHRWGSLSGIVNHELRHLLEQSEADE